MADAAYYEMRILISARNNADRFIEKSDDLDPMTRGTVRGWFMDYGLAMFSMMARNDQRSMEEAAAWVIARILREESWPVIRWVGERMRSLDIQPEQH